MPSPARATHLAEPEYAHKASGKPGVPPLWGITRDGRLDLNLHVGQGRAWESTKRYIAIIAGSQSGKALDLDTEIPTPTGFVRMGDLAVGDLVLDEWKQPCRVTGVSAIHLGHSCYRLTFHDGTTVVADAEHLWMTRVSAPLAWEPGIAIRTTAELAQTLRDHHEIGSRDGTRLLVACEAVPTRPVRCISVDSPSSLYLCTRTYLPTHNTSFGPLWLWNEIRKCGPGDYLMVTPTIPLSKLKALPEFLRFFDEALALGKWHAADRYYEISREGGMRLYGQAEVSRIIFGSAVNPESLESATAKAAWLDECGQQQFKLESWEAIQRRLLLHVGRAIMTTTPYSLGWLKVAIYDPWKTGDPEVDVLQFASTVNPMITEASLERAKRDMPKWRYEMMYEGKFSKPDDLIYGDYNDDLREQGGMQMTPIPIQPHWPVYVGVDFGGANTVTLWIAQNTDNDEVYVFHETHAGGISTATHCQNALDYRDQGDLRGYPLRVHGYIGGAQNEGQSRLDWTANGVPIEEPPVKGVNEGIDRVTALLRSGRFFVFSTCRRLRSEFGSYQRKMTEGGEVLEEILHKNRYHAADALRYGSQKIILYGLDMGASIMILDKVKQKPPETTNLGGWVPRESGVMVPGRGAYLPERTKRRVAWV